jgi:hypothetical protein
VAGDEHRDAGVGPHPQQVEDRALGRVIELASGFVGQQHDGVVGQRHGQAGAGQFSARQLARVGVRTRADAERGEHSGDRGRFGGVRQLLSEGDVLANGQVGEQVAALKQQADVAPAHPGPDRLGLMAQALVADAYGSAVGFVGAGQARQQGGFAGAGRADEGDELAGPDAQADPLQCERLFLAGPEEPVQRPRLDRGRRLREDGGHAFHPKESVTLRQGSTLSDPTGAARVSTTSVPLRQNS